MGITTLEYCRGPVVIEDYSGDTKQEQVWVYINGAERCAASYPLQTEHTGGYTLALKKDPPPTGGGLLYE